MDYSRKRKHAQDASGGRDGQNTKKQRPDPAAKRQFDHKRRQNRPYAAQDNEPRTDSTNSLKSRIRNLKRLLEHIDNDPANRMPANVRIERDRELQTCEHELAEKQAADREAEFRNKVIGKYHHIRFFERQKATRTVKRLHKQLSALDDEREKTALLRRIHNAEIDANYTIYYPLLKPYISLFPKDKTSPVENVEVVDGPKGNLEVWKAVEIATEEGTLEVLRNSKEGVSMPGLKDPPLELDKGRNTKKDHRREQKEKNVRAKAPNGDDEDSDGGFFE